MPRLESSRARWRVTALSHLVNDLHAQFVQVFTPLLAARLGLSLGQAGALTSLGGVMHMVVQPVAGYLSDRSGNNHLIVGGMLAAGFFSFLIPLASNFATALAFVFLWGLGTACFPPQAQGAASYSARPEELSRSISLFSFGGMLGSSLSPLYGVFMYQTFSPAILPLAGLAIPLLAAAAVVRVVPQVKDPASEPSGLRRLPSKLANMFGRIWPVWCVTFLRDTTCKALSFLLPLLVALRGGDLTQVGTVLFFLTFFSALAPLALVRLWPSARASRLLLFTLPIAAALLFVSRWLPLWTAVGAMSAASLFLTCSTPLVEVIAQSMAPNDRSTSSSLTMGLSFGAAGVMMTPLGFLAGRIGIEHALSLTALLPIAALGVVTFIWPRRIPGAALGK